MPRVYNKRLKNTQYAAPEGAVYVGRPTVYGNPFNMSKAGYSRQEAIDLYRDWIWQPEQAALRNRMRKELAGRDLVCWCAPLPCHADHILRIANGN